jgi:hypothetical protein
MTKDTPVEFFAIVHNPFHGTYEAFINDSGIIRALVSTKTGFSVPFSSPARVYGQSVRLVRAHRCRLGNDRHPSS